MKASAIAALAIALSAGVEAHHSFSAVFDDMKPVRLQGVVTKVEWMNPHVWFYLDVKDDRAQIVKWQCEGGNPNTLVRQGWRRDTLAVGTSVDIEGWLARDGSHTCNARTITADGKRLFAGSSAGR